MLSHKIVRIDLADYKLMITLNMFSVHRCDICLSIDIIVLILAKISVCVHDITPICHLHKDNGC